MTNSTSTTGNQMNGRHSNPPIISAAPNTSMPGAAEMMNIVKIANANTPSIRPKPVASNVPVGLLANCRPVQGGATISLPQGVSLPPGTVLMKNDKGHLVIVSRPPLPQAQPKVVPRAIRPIAQATTPANITTGLPDISINRNLPQPAAQIRPKVQVAISDDVKKCKNFLETLIRLSAQQPAHTFASVKNLIQGLLDGSVPAENFTIELQKELKSQKQPGLAPFLKKSLPELRAVVKGRRLSITGLGTEWISKLEQSEAENKSKPPSAPTKPTPSTAKPAMAKPAIAKPATTKTTAKAPVSHIQSVHINRTNIPASKPLPTPILPAVTPAASSPKISVQVKTTPSGIKLPEPAPSKLPEDLGFLQNTALTQRINTLLFRKGMKNISSDVMVLLSNSCRERLRHVLSKTIVAAEHRLEPYRADQRYVQVGNVRSQLKFLENLDKLEKKRKDDQERETLLRAAKSRTKTEDPEQAKLKQKAKEMQQAEMEVARQRDANLTALAAIGPRKRKNEDTKPSLASGVSGLPLSKPTDQNPSTLSLRPRLKRLNLRDVQYISEQDRQLTKSLVLYKSMLR